MSTKYASKTDDNSITGYIYVEAYVIDMETDDAAAMKEFQDRIDAGYTINPDPAKTNHCATGVQKSLRKAGVSIKGENAYWPSVAYMRIKNSIGGRVVRRKQNE